MAALNQVIESEEWQDRWLSTSTEREADVLESQLPLCGNGSDSWLQFIEKQYGAVHGHASIGMCVISILMNIANVVVLTRRHMVSPSNTLLTAIAFVDILKMSTYMFYAYYFNIKSRVNDPSNRYSASLVLFLIVQTNSALVLHCNNTWFTVLLAVFRYIVVCVDNGRQVITVTLARRSVAVVFLLSCLVYIPHYFSLGLAQECDYPQTSETNRSETSQISANNSLSRTDGPTCYYLVNPNNEQLRKLSHLIHGPVLKILSSILICIPTALLIARMRKAAQTRRRLKSKLPGSTNSASSLNATTSSGFFFSVRKRLRKRFGSDSSRADCMLKCSCACSTRRPSDPKSDGAFLPTDVRAKSATNDHSRTTTMLIAVITSFVVVEFPQGVILWVGHFNKFFFECVYSPLGDLFDALVLVSSSINFLIYCTMSQQYRQTFRMVLIEPLMPGRSKGSTRAPHSVVNGRDEPKPCSSSAMQAAFNSANDVNAPTRNTHLLSVPTSAV